ncbi:MAG: radical SAM family heme chaperone HemW [Dehalococcoidia bacterium]|nr:radical SAM family heme chaperone HemW [Dehalococcoidia bacterium]
MCKTIHATDTQERSPEAKARGTPIALYIHIPFCETRCPYCDFNTYEGIEPLMPAYIDALVQEIRLWGSFLTQGQDTPLPQPISTVFFGGGTPSYLPPENIQRVLDAARAAFSLAPDAEVTLESNPGDVTTTRLEMWKAAGINRVSIGVQSLDDGLLQLLGRRHDSQAARQAYQNARHAGFDNLNLDLMYGLPGQSLAQWRSTLTDTLHLAPEHISMYCLTLEEGTPLDAWVRQGKVPEPDPDLAADMYLLAEDLAGGAGYEHYEISNWAMPGRACRHNLIYWRNQPYLGVGPGAHSYMGGYRFANLKSPRQYIQRVNQWADKGAMPLSLADLRDGGPLDTVDAIDAPTEMGETMIMGLRLGQGVSEAGFQERFGVGLRERYGPQIDELEQLGLLEWRQSWLRLTPRGRLLGNEVFQRFLV